MKKRIPKVFAVALSAAMLASLSATTVFAQNTVYTVEEITDPDAEYTAARVGYELACSYSDKDGLLEHPRLIEQDEITADIFLNEDLKILEMKFLNAIWMKIVSIAVFQIFA